MVNYPEQHSYAEVMEFTCPQCRNSFNADLWLIVDIEERVELAQRIYDNKINQVICPNCRELVSRVDAPLLIFQPSSEPHLVFSPDSVSSGTQIREQAAWLVEQLRRRVQEGWKEEWIAKGVPPIPRHQLAVALGSRPTLLGLINLLTETEDWLDERRLLQKYPQLLSKDADVLLGEMLATVHQVSIPQAEPILERVQTYLREARTEGVDRMLAQKMGLTSFLDSRSAEELVALIWELSQPYRVRDLPSRIQLYHRALELVGPEQIPALWAGFQIDLATSLANSEAGNRAENLEASLSHYRMALGVARREKLPELWANAQMNLGLAYTNRFRGDRAENVEKAIYHCGQALEVYTRESHPEDWARATHNLGLALVKRVRALRADNIEEGINLMKQALPVMSRAAPPEEWATAQIDLAYGYYVRLEGERGENLEECIRYLRNALGVHTRDSNPEKWARAISNLGKAYAAHVYGNRQENLDMALAEHKKALQVYGRDDYPRSWASVQANLGDVYHKYAVLRVDKAENRERAIYHYERALEVLTEFVDALDWGRAHAELGVLYRQRARGRRIENMETAISHLQQALKVYSYDAYPEEWAMTQREMGIAFMERLHGDRATNLEQALIHLRRSLTRYSRDSDPESWAKVQNELGLVYIDRISGDPAKNRERAVRHFRRALALLSYEASPIDWAMTHNNLGIAFFARAMGDRKANLEHAIHHYKQALKVYRQPNYQEDYAGTKKNLGAAFRVRINGLRAHNLEEAIRYLMEALEVYTRADFPEGYANVHNELGNAFRERIRGEQTENLNVAIDHYHEALTVYKPEDYPEDWAMTLSNLAATLVQRAGPDHVDDVESAIVAYKATLRVLTREAYPERWAHIQNSLGLAYLRRVSNDEAEDRELAIYHLMQGLEVRTRDTLPFEWAKTQLDLGLAYLSRIRGTRAVNLEHAIQRFQYALEVYTHDDFPERWAAVQSNLAIVYMELSDRERSENLRLAIQHSQAALEVYTVGAFPLEHMITQSNLGNAYFDEGLWSDAEVAYEAATEAGRRLLAEAYSESGRQVEVARTAHIFGRLSYSLLQQGNIEGALLALEKGKTRLLAEALAITEADLALLTPAQARELNKVRQMIRDIESEMRLPAKTAERRTERELADALSQRRASLNELVEEIRTQHPEFMPVGLDLPALLNLIPVGGALVAPIVTSRGSAVFVIRHGVDKVMPEDVIWLDHFTEETLDALIFGEESKGGWLLEYFNYKAKLQQAIAISHHQASGIPADVTGAVVQLEEAQVGWWEAVRRLAFELWQHFMQPVWERLQALQLETGAPILLMPTGGLGLLPVHAAWYKVDGEKHYFIDDYTITYVPSGYTLAISQSRAVDRRNDQSRLMIVVNPTMDLKYAGVEGQAVRAFFGSDVAELNEHSATLKAILEEVSGKGYLHFSCHGSYNWAAPMKSALLLAENARLSLDRIIAELDLHASRLVVLSACETGITDIRHSPDEFVGLPTGFLQAGAPGVVSTLWAVNDASTAMLLSRFYAYYLKDGMEPAEALRQAQLWLRDTTDGEKRAFFWISERGETWLSPSAAKAFYQALAFTKDDTRSFEHPYYWAAFTYTGA